ncbi:MAG TPA: VWA domain-containing protein [Bryobacteraceae bacterium]|nr:VWA domain-containing protein [Bryobacteraceae bacterium]HOL70082.1 VWA domain-containing protein [Bryobacteraceae bacterium]HOQ43848.1 VWA domain-containing protein [Bryobacteraceae bacterium]HPQ14687.1 VWA domain-containing protein [Bryobacteraceae bacterium]HPU71709.1 VWA domain-containing protein [Bryobacteraceae bacterium]
MRQRNNIPALLAAIALAVPVWGQEGAAVFRADTRLVVLHATVVDKHGKLITNLDRNAFQVFEDGVEQPIKIFRREDVPVSMGILVDNSGSMRDKRRKVEDAAMALVKASNPYDEIFVVNFNDEAYLDVDFTSDPKKLEEGVARIDSRGGTAMRDAIDLAMDHLLKKAKRDKKVLVVITDGNDNASEISLERLIQRTQQREVAIYTIGLLDEEERREARRAKRALDALAEATGGQAYYPKNVDDVGKFTLEVAHEIRNQYTLAYSPLNANLDGTFRQVKVTVKAKGNPRVRTRSGYYAIPELARTGAGAPGS